MRVLGIETSCDETGVALYEAGKGLLSDQLYRQVALHAQYGGVVPELASRDHVKKLPLLTRAALAEAGIGFNQIDAIAYTAGPGLAGALMVGASFAKSLGAIALRVPTLGVHHLEAHLLAVMLEEHVPTYPYVALLVSGGHTALVSVSTQGYKILGETLDDAAGEAFDKTAKLLGLPYPGGEALAKLAQQGSPRFTFPRPLSNKPGLDFSYSGLKTHVANMVKNTPFDRQLYADIAYAFQEAVVDTLVIKAKRALEYTHFSTLVIAGGVGANQRLRERLTQMAWSLGAQVFYPRPAYCTDNGAMVAYLGCQRLMRGQKDASLSIKVRSRWPLDELLPL